jgi:excisionase family DNA binding protein
MSATGPVIVMEAAQVDEVIEDLAMVDVPTLARLWGVCTRTVYRYVKSGDLRVVRTFGNSIRIPVAEAKRFMAERAR